MHDFRSSALLALAAALCVAAAPADVGAQGGLTHIFSVGVDARNLRDLSGTRAGSDQLASVSPDARRIVFVRANALWLMNADGSGKRLLLAAGASESFVDPTFQPPSWSPSSTSVAVNAVSTANCSPSETKCADWYVDVVDLQGHVVQRLDDARNFSWSPRGSVVAYEHGEDGGFSLTPEETQIVVSRLDGSGLRSVTPDAARLGAQGCLASPRWSSSGRYLAVEKTNCDDLSSSGMALFTSAVRLVRTLPEAGDPIWSRLNALAFRRSGTLYVAREDGTQPKRITGSLAAPVWSRDGRLLAFVTPVGRLAIVGVRSHRVRTLIGPTSPTLVGFTNGPAARLVFVSPARA